MNKTQKYYKENKEQKKLYQYNYYHNTNITYKEYLEIQKKNAREYQKKYRNKKKLEKNGYFPQTLIINRGKYHLDFT